MIVYLVTSGTYSAYAVEGVFSTRALAKAFVAKRGGDEIEEMVLDAREHEERVSFWTCCMSLADGSCRHYGPWERLLLPTRKTEITFRGKAWRPSTPSVQVSSPVSEEHAHKVAVEKRQEWAATGGIQGSKEVKPT